MCKLVVHRLCMLISYFGALMYRLRKILKYFAQRCRPVEWPLYYFFLWASDIKFTCNYSWLKLNGVKHKGPCHMCWVAEENVSQNTWILGTSCVFEKEFSSATSKLSCSLAHGHSETFYGSVSHLVLCSFLPWVHENTLVSASHSKNHSASCALMLKWAATQCLQRIKFFAKTSIFWPSLVWL